MKKTLERIIEIPSGINVTHKENTFTVTGNGKEITKTLDIGKITVNITTDTIKLHVKNATRRESTMIGTIWATLKNMIAGVTQDFEYKLEICNVHFPMNVKAEGDKIIIKSFLGETTERIAKIISGATVDIKGNQITITSHDINAAGQTAANLEKATRLKGRDRRIFQDGIFITEKNGRTI